LTNQGVACILQKDGSQNETSNYRQAVTADQLNGRITPENTIIRIGFT
jgi:hypothetical protein